MSSESSAVIHWWVRFREPLRFVLVGGVNTLFGFGVYALGLFLGLNYVVAALVSQICGTLFNYLTYGRLVFRAKPSWTQLVRFVLTYAVLYGVSVGLLTLFQHVGLSALVAGVVNGVCIPLMSFVLNKLLVFKSGVHPRNS